MEPFFGAVFLPSIKRLVEVRLTYEQVKAIVQISPAVGAKITRQQFVDRTTNYWKQPRTGTR
jgi:hypothetical protein